MPAFLFASDLPLHHASWPAAIAQLDSIGKACAPVLGFEPALRLASLTSLESTIEETVFNEDGEIFVLPAVLDFHLWQREALGRVLGEARRRHPHTAIHHDDPDPAHPLLIDAFADQAARALAKANAAPHRAGVLVAADGNGDPGSRAQTYRLMRLLWEQLGLAQGEVGFLRHGVPFLLHALERCAGQRLRWLLLPQSQWETEPVEYARVILANFQRSQPEAADWLFADPLGAHPLLAAWYGQRVIRLWQERRAREGMRVASARSAPPPGSALWKRGCGYIARVRDSETLSEVLRQILPSKTPERILVKVTWHGYATGTYTDPAALDWLLRALPVPAVILEGHTTSRNLGGATFDWEATARQHRVWIRQQEAEYLRRTGLGDVLARHGAQYLNVTEAFWDEDCVPQSEIEQLLSGGAVALRFPELAGFIPNALLAFRGCPMISFAKFKGPTRLGIANMFGLLPPPLRAAWHGPNITWFARVCCDLARLYGALFELCGVSEALFSAVRWSRRGLYRSRWGNYDLTLNRGYLTCSRSIVSADILASRLQGQDVHRSSFFDVVRQELGWDPVAAGQPLPDEIRAIFT